ncbi:eukaryotic translation initiation factor 4 gamma 3-like [Lucilia sericata]|uniref:eukaryotic translation initiation factor 4 gamma 3-like n=1 Tax=Lucilia sericata TaxID=13632 RepID=UPI0018A82389|nr:eukaryotic translation initiation factor 4 gamma 3-like [Lucilia sericata]
MQPQSTKSSYNGTSKSVNTNAQSRTNHSYGGNNNNRQQSYAGSTPRNRHIQTAAIFPPLHPGMVMSQFNAAAYAAQRPPNLQQCQYTAQFYPQLYYPYYVPQLPQQQHQGPQQQQGGNVGSIMATMTLPPGSFVGGPPGNQSSLTYAAVTPSNSLISVNNTSAAQNLVLGPLQQNSVQVQTPLTYGLNAVANSSSMVNTTAPGPSVNFASTRMTFAAAALAGNTRMAANPSVMPTTQPQIKAKLRSHALQIIHPVTNKNILQDLNNDKEISFPAGATSSETQIVEKQKIKSCKSLEMVQQKDHILNPGDNNNEHIKAMECSYKDASQQAEQIAFPLITTQDACVEIIPNIEDLKKMPSDENPKDSAENDQQLQQKEQLSSGVSSSSLNFTENKAASITVTKIEGLEKNLEKINHEQETSLKFRTKTIITTEEEGSGSSTDIKIPENRHKDITLDQVKEYYENDTKETNSTQTPFDTVATDEDFEDAHTCTDTSSILEEQEALNQAYLCTDTEEIESEYVEKDLLLERQMVKESRDIKLQPLTKTLNLRTDNEKFESEFVKEESLLDNYENRELNSSPRQRKQYTRKQLMQLRQSKHSCQQPEVKNYSIFAPMNLMPAFAAKSPKMAQNLITSARGNHSGYINYQQNNYIKTNSRTNRNNNSNNSSVATAGASVLQNNKSKGKDLIYLNLCLKEDVKLNESDNAWKPRVLAKDCPEADTNLPPEKEELIRRVRGILNKLTPEKFEPLVEEIIKLKIDTLDKMEAVMNLVFEKAIDEPNFSLCYAKLCHRLISEVKASDERMASTTKTNLAYFRNALLDKTEREFTHHVTKINAKEEKLKPIREKYDKCQDPNEKIELEALLNEEERKIRRRSGGTVRFIGELFKISILSGKIIHSCIEALLKDPTNEDMLECLCKLLTTVGQKFEQTCLAPEDKRKYSLKSVIQRMQNIAVKNENSKISSRIRFMLQDVIDLRKKRWQSTRNEAPKTMEQIEKEVNNPTTMNKKTENLTNSLPESKRSLKTDSLNMAKRLERSTGGSGSGSGSEVKQNPRDSKANDKWQVHGGKVNSSQALDSSKLVGLSNMDMNNKKMGGVSLFQWKKLTSPPATSAANSFAVLSNMEANKATKYPPYTEQERKRNGSQAKHLQNKPEVNERKEVLKSNQTRNPSRMTKASKNLNQNKYRNDMEASTSRAMRSPPPVHFKEPNNAEIKLIKSVITDMLENALNSKNIDSETVTCFLNLPINLRCPLIYYILTDYLHLANIKALSRRYLALVVNYLITNNYLSLEHFHLAYRNFADLASDLIVDIPELWRYIFEFTGPLLVKNLITVNDLWPQQLKESSTTLFKQKFLKTLILYCTREVGPSFTRNLWQKYHIKWSDFLPQMEVDNFIINNNFEFIENPLKSYTHIINNKYSPEILQKRVMDHIQQLLKENCHPDFIIDYINGNIIHITRNFIKNLTPLLASYALKDQANYSLDIGKFQKVSLPILRRYLDSQEPFELECLEALHCFVENLDNPQGLWDSICAELYGAEVIAQETFMDWQNSKN